MSQSDEAFDEASAEVVAKREMLEETFVLPVDASFELTLFDGSWTPSVQVEATRCSETVRDSVSEALVLWINMATPTGQRWPFIGFACQDYIFGIFQRILQRSITSALLIFVELPMPMWCNLVFPLR